MKSLVRYICLVCLTVVLFACQKNDQPLPSTQKTDHGSTGNLSNFNVHFNIYPNPTTSKFLVEIETPEETDVVLSARDIYGKNMYQKAKELAEGENKFEIETTGWPAGLYFVVAKFDGFENQAMLRVK